MKLQQLIFKVEELKAIASMYEQTQQGLAQAQVLITSVDADTDADTRAKVEESLATLTSRFQSLERLFLERTGCADVDAAVEYVQAHIARLQHFQQVRSEQLQLRTQLDLELAMGALPPETRQGAEDSLQNLQLRLETLVRQGHEALPSSRILTLS